MHHEGKTTPSETKAVKLSQFMAGSELEGDVAMRADQGTVSPPHFLKGMIISDPTLTVYMYVCMSIDLLLIQIKTLLTLHRADLSWLHSTRTV